MTALALAITAIGVALSVAVSIRAGFNVVSTVMLVLIVGAGALVVGVVSRGRAGGVAPGGCPECGGLISPHAPYCKHCGASLEQEQV